jgi:hypothetical protein
MFLHLPRVWTNSKEMSPWEADRLSSTQEFSNILLHQEFHCLFTRPPSAGLYPEPHESNPSHHISLKYILILSSHLRLGIPSDLFPSDVHMETLHDPVREEIIKPLPVKKVRFRTELSLQENCCSAVGIATGYELNGQGVVVRVPAGLRILFSPYYPDRLSAQARPLT